MSESLGNTTKQLQILIQENSNPSKVDQRKISTMYQELIDCVIDHNHLYYVEASPIISDYEYDQLFDYLKKIEEYYPFLISGNSPTQGLVGQIQEGFEKAKHRMPMLSLENSYNAEDLRGRDERLKRFLEKEEISINNIFYYIEPKIDGLSIELIYRNGEFKQALTRGDGLVGEDVTENIRTIKNIPKKLRNVEGIKEISFRGEVVIGKSDLEKINNERELQGLPIYANTRNLASGSLKQLDTNITKSRNLKCYMYDKWSNFMTYIGEPKHIENIVDKIYNKSIEDFGFERLSIKNEDYNNIEDIIKFCENLETKDIITEKYNNVEFDGLVIKIRDKKIGDKRLRDIIGSTAHHPRRAIAYKFPAEQVSTQINSIDFQVGRTGIITPVANLEPVNLSGATISRVSLHNFDFIKDKDIHYNDYIWLQRSGEVIPYVVGVIKERRENIGNPPDKGGKGGYSDSLKEPPHTPLSGGRKRDHGGVGSVLPPTHCPSCDTPLTNIDIHYYCQNINCPAQIKEKIIWFVSKNCMDIEGIGESIVDILVEHGIVKNIIDLYKLLDFETERVVRRFPGFADKKVFEIKKQLEESKKKPLWRLINALGIPGIGKKTAQDIAQQLAISKQEGSSEEESNLGFIIKHFTDRERLESIYGVGEKLIDGIINFVKDNAKLLEALEKVGLNFGLEDKASNQDTQDNLAGGAKGSFSITGTFQARTSISRPKIIEEMQKNGYTFHESPNKDTDIMLVGGKAGGKKEKAESLGIEILEGWEALVNKLPFLASLDTIDKLKSANNGPEQRGLF